MHEPEKRSFPMKMDRINRRSKIAETHDAITEGDYGSVPQRPFRHTEGGGSPRRGPVIRTSDFVAEPNPVRDNAPADDRFHGVSERLARLAATKASADAGRPAYGEPERERGVEASVPPRREHPASASAAGAQVDTPIIDAAMVIKAAWLNRWLILLTICVMGGLGGALSTLLPRQYTATTTLYFEPQENNLDTQQSAGLSQEMVLARIDSQAQILVSRRVLTAVAKDLGLETDPEFGGPPITTTANLADAITVQRQDNTYVVNLAVKSKDPQKAAVIANAAVKAFTTEQETAATGDYDSTASALDGRLEELAAQLKQAEQAVADFKAQNNIDTPAPTDPDQVKRTASLEELLLVAQSKTIAAKALYDAVSRYQVADLVTGGTPAEGIGNSSSALAQLQDQYAAAAANVSNLETKLGARHPQLIAARATLSSVQAAITGEVGRMTKAAQADYERAKAEEDSVAKSLSVQRALDNNKSGPLIDYRELRRKADAARDIYEAVLKRSRLSSQEQLLAKNNIRVISAAEAPIKPDGPRRAVLLAACTFGGLIGGFVLGLLVVVIRLFTNRVRSTA